MIAFLVADRSHADLPRPGLAQAVRAPGAATAAAEGVAKTDKLVDADADVDRAEYEERVDDAGIC